MKPKSSVFVVEISKEGSCEAKRFDHETEASALGGCVGRMWNRRAALISFGVAAIGAIVHAVKRILGGKEDYDGFGDVVSYSSQRIAAVRALEMEEEAPICNDPLASCLAGERALQTARKFQVAAPSGSDRKHKINARVMRARWFDDQIEASLDISPVILEDMRADYVANTVVRGHVPKQVVMLGAGMDSRPWRLRLPADVAWFEVDVQDVLEKKIALLKCCGAEVESQTAFRHVGRSMSYNTALKEKIGTLDHHASGVRFPLRAASWTPVFADLQDRKWAEKLVEAGFDKTKPTVWVAEGLLMYLAPDHANALASETSRLSAPGSALVTVSVTEQVIEDIRKKGTKSELMREWKFGCPGDPKGWLRGAGWQPALVASRGFLADALGLDPDVCAFDGKGRGNDGRLLFMAATPMSKDTSFMGMVAQVMLKDAIEARAT